jgi:hypothetical protein
VCCINEATLIEIRISIKERSPSVIYGSYGIFLGNPEGKRSLGRPRRRWVNNINIDLRNIRWDDMDWIDLAQNRDQ